MLHFYQYGRHDSEKSLQDLNRDEQFTIYIDDTYWCTVVEANDEEVAVSDAYGKISVFDHPRDFWNLISNSSIGIWSMVSNTSF